MAKPYKLLRAKMPLAAREKAEAKTRQMLREMPLFDLRRARSLSQEQMARMLNVNQSAISKIERRTDMYISTLRNFVHAMGGELEVIVHFPDGDVKVTKFEDL